MKISELLKESQQLDELKASDIGRGVGKVAKGVGAVAGGVAGIPGAVKKGFQAGKTAVGGADEKPAPAQTTTAAQANQTAQDQTTAQTPEPAQDQGGGIIDKFKQGWNKARSGQQPAAEKPDAEPAAGSATASKEILQTQKEIQMDLADLKKQVATLSSMTLKSRDEVMGPTSDSIIRTGNNLSEQLESKVQKYKNSQFKEQILSGAASLFVK